MSDDDVDHELLALLRQKFGLGGSNPNAPPETKVLEHAQFICDNSLDVALSMVYTKNAAIAVLGEMQKREYSTKTWAEHELHPKSKDEATVNFIFTMDLLNFSFWSEKSDEARFTVSYKGKKWTGYWSLVAALQRALDEGIPITSPGFWIDDGKDAEEKPNNDAPVSSDTAPPSWSDPEAPRLPNDAFDTGVYPDTAPKENGDEPAALTEDQTSESATVANEQASQNEPNPDAVVSEDAHEVHTPDARSSQEHLPKTSEEDSANETVVVKRFCTEDLLRHVFRSDTGEEIPMFAERLQCLQEAGQILHEQFDGSVVTLIEDAKGSAARLVNLLADRFPCFRDEATFERKKVRFLKRAQIFVADLWAAFEGEGYGEFNDIDKITMFADYRVPQILNSLGLMQYCPPLEARIRRGKMIPSGHSWELQIRGCSIWAIELLRREILKLQPDAKINAILLDFFLYDLAKEKERAGEESLPHHKTRSIWY
ncbi:hypothetical protein BU23DRAFT_145924 [Bimuria novae-zelandiae CBS 107.79]|uniref:Queuosine 5'-phosphate N-glycosylase/hydrolase n=1 Tax=Bimuria novae-zelandiae CBS 107.79 TaxID=1447943 RepID=A0A6A5V8B0_9PLEO|nr:hypothetical protein BU23DRAFT_145924 [Bimuria novae-zelandiae CBS 107.79]